MSHRIPGQNGMPMPIGVPSPQPQGPQGPQGPTHQVPPDGLQPRRGQLNNAAPPANAPQRRNAQLPRMDQQPPHFMAMPQPHVGLQPWPPQAVLPPLGQQPRRNRLPPTPPQTPPPPGQQPRRNRLTPTPPQTPPPMGQQPRRNRLPPTPPQAPPPLGQQPRRNRLPPTPPQTPPPLGQQPRRNRLPPTPLQTPPPLGQQPRRNRLPPTPLQTPPPPGQQIRRNGIAPIPATTSAAPPQPGPLTGLYQRINLKISGETMPAFTDEDVTGNPKKLGSGAFNTVFEVQLRKPGGAILDGVFKPLNPTERGWVAMTTGVDPNNPQIAMRNLATVAYAKALGFDVVPETKLAVISAPTLDGPPAPQLGLVMERAAGKDAWSQPMALLDRPEVMREMTKLQLLDHLTGQGDRHGQNCFIDVRADGSVKVTGIDNDQCFGSKLTDPAGIRDTHEPHTGFRGTGLPPVVDPEMATAIQGLTPDKLRDMLGGKLNEAEIGAAMQRLAGVQHHVAMLQGQGLVLPMNQWTQVAHLFTPENSYGARDIANAHHAAQQMW